MVDVSVDAASNGAGARASASWRIDKRTALIIAALVAAAIGWQFARTEGRLGTQMIAAGVTFAFAAMLVVLTRRLAFAALVTGLVVLGITLAARLKLAAMNVVLHAYDLVFYLSDGPTARFLITTYSKEAAIIGAVLACVVIAGAVLFRRDASRLRRLPAALAALAGLGVAVAGAQVMGERRHQQFEYDGQFISSFALSWTETIETLAKGQLIDAAATSVAPPFASPANCTPAQKPPHIILIHQESVVPPEFFPQLSYDKSLDPFFRSFDGRLHRLRVETYGGNSMMTEFSVLTGLSTRSFGGMRQFVQSLMAGKINDTLPQTLARCGYRNVMFYPMLRNFVQTSRFFAGVGLNEMYDMKDQGAPTIHERDRFYYANALGLMEQHVANSQQPLFTFIETMATHWPYHVTYWPDEAVPGGGPGTYGEMHEYLRRLGLAKRDFDWMKDELKRRFPNEKFLIVQYGDHHPMSTRVYLDFGDGTEAEDVVLPPDSLGFQTYFAVNGLNYRPPLLPRHQTVDVAFLSTLILESARLPLPDSYKERRRLLEVCNGRYYDCARQENILAFHRRLIDSDLVQAR